MNSYKKNRRLVWISLAVVAVILVASFGLFRVFSKGANAIARPAFSLKETVREWFDGISFHWQTKKSLVAQNENLKNTLEEYRLRLAYGDFVASENEKLKELLGAKPASQVSILAKVLAGPKTSFYDTLLIDLGAAEVAIGAKVILPPNILLGEVAEISGRTAKVKLYSTSGVATEAKLSVSGIPVKIIGRGGGNFKMSLPRDIEVALDGAITLPPDYLLGFIKKIENDPRQPEQTIFASSPVNIFTLDHVFVVQ
jgi:cell shape-determining protein MreC